ncbi:MAG: cryptochrome/photolyase family protein [Steroidobacteraceae bacterium]|jgi:deoxyribodipyrimidine photo-lyase
MTATLLWLRQDLRLADQPALQAALERGEVIPVFIWSPEEEGEWQPGAATRWWLHQSLAALATELEKRGSRLVLRRATRSLDSLRELLAETGATAVYWGRRYEPQVIARDAEIKNALRADGIEVRSFNTALLIEPWDVQNLSGKPFQVFTPYWRKACTAINPPKPVAAPARIAAPSRWPKSLPLDELRLMPNIAWHGGMAKAWRPGEHGAAALLKTFLGGAVKDYAEQRNMPAVPGTSRLSPHLHFGEISPRQIWHAAPEWRSTQFITEIGWREFAHHLLYHFPRTTNAPLRPDFERFPWRENAADLLAWQHGRTGIPLVDAGMRELWETGWMHNRVRMVVASFLVKNLRMHWLHGARWFWDTLVDADLASNTLGWQWAAGCGADAAPYFRVFNPASQADKFDPQGEYQRRWLGNGPRPAPIVDLKASREEALAAFKTLRS